MMNKAKLKKSLINLKKREFGNLSFAFRSIKKNPVNLIFPVVSDLTFFVILGFLFSPIFSRIVEYASAIGTKMIEISGKVSQRYDPDSYINEILMNEEIRALSLKLFLLFLFSLIIFYLLYTVFQSVSWFISHKIAGSRISYHRFLSKFAIVNLFWAALFFIIEAFSLLHQINMTIASKIPGYQEKTTIFYPILIFCLIYFSSISYSLLTGKSRFPSLQSLKIGLFNIHRLFILWLVIILVIFLISNLQSIIGFSPMFGFIFQVFVNLPLITFFRISIIKSVDSVKD